MMKEVRLINGRVGVIQKIEVAEFGFVVTPVVLKKN